MGQRNRRHDAVATAPPPLEAEVFVQDRDRSRAVVDDADLDGGHPVGQLLLQAAGVPEARDDADAGIDGDGRGGHLRNELSVLAWGEPSVAARRARKEGRDQEE